MSEERDEAESTISLLGRIQLTDRTLIAAFPVVAYAVVYVYKWGYYSAYGLPAELMTFSITVGFNVFLKLVAALWILFSALNFVFSMLPRKMPHSLARKIDLWIPLFLLLVGFFYFQSDKRLVFISLGLFIIVSSMMFLPPILMSRDKGTYLERMELLAQKHAPPPDIWEDTRSLVYWITRHLGYRRVVMIFNGAAVLLAIYIAGYGSAQKQDIYRVASTSPETVVLVVDSDKMIVAPFDRQARLIEPSFRILHFQSDSDVEFRLEKVGPLRLQAGVTGPPVAASPTAAAKPTAARSTACPSPSSTPTASPSMAPLPTVSATRS